jgi:uncharacterized protein YlxW (UPF0749 family)
MKIKRDALWIGSVCILLGIIMSLQFKTVQKNFLQGQSPSQKSAQLVGELTKLKNEKELLTAEIETLENKLKEIENTESKGNVVIKNLNEDLLKYRSFAGLTDVYGPGIEIFIDNPSKDSNTTYESNLVYDYEVIVNLVNELNAAGAEAISINDQRILSQTEIRAAGENININKVPQTAPFILKVIGDSTTLEGALTGRFGIVSVIREKNYQLDIKKMEKVTIPRYKGLIEFRYSNVIE